MVEAQDEKEQTTREFLSRNTVHSPAVTYVSMALLLLLSPPFVIVLWFTMVECNGSFFTAAKFFGQHGMNGLYELWPKPSRTAVELILAFGLFEAFLQIALPGKEYHGPLSPTGHRPVYKKNGFTAFVTTLALYYFLWRQKLFNPSVVYDHLGEILSTLNFGSLAFVLALLVKGHVAPSSTDAGSSGNLLIDFYWGMELYPRIGKRFDIKQFTNCRFGMMSWAALVLSYNVKQVELYGKLSNSLLVSSILMFVYIAKFFWWESGYMASMDIAHDRAGFYIAWGCLVWVPSVYTSPALYMVNNPVELHPLIASLILFAGIICVYVNYECDYQRQLFRQTEGRANIWGRTPSKIVAHYTTGVGEKAQSLLLTSGWWGVARHFHYAPEIMAAFLWSLPASFYNVIYLQFSPYFYPVYLTILLVDRANRQEERCKAKYHKYWEQYCQTVRYNIIPGVY